MCNPCMSSSVSLTSLSAQVYVVHLANWVAFPAEREILHREGP